MSTMAESRSRRPRRRFTDEFKQQAVRLVLDEGKSVTAVARELDLVASALGPVGQARAGRSDQGPHRPDDGGARGAGRGCAKSICGSPRKSGTS